MNIVCVGDCGIDRYAPAGEILCGGITANFALQARAAFPEDDTITIVSAVGNDDAASIVHGRLRDSGIDCHIASLNGPTSVQHVEVLPDGERNFVHYDEGVLRCFALSEGDKAQIAASDLRVLPVFKQIYDFFDRVIAIGNAGLTAVDFADFAQHPDFALLDRYLDAIDVGFFGLSGDDESLIDAIEQKAVAHGKLLVVTLGPDGSMAFHGDDTVSCAAVHVDKVVDTTGAGDAFAAGFLSQYCYGQDVSTSLQKGALLASGIIQRMGAN
jgi:sugar/nucleoside kinase (ribokinase family)